MPACFGRQRGSGLASAAQTLCDPVHVTLGHIPSSLIAPGKVSVQLSPTTGVPSCSQEAQFESQRLVPSPHFCARKSQGTSPSQDREFDGC